MRAALLLLIACAYTAALPAPSGHNVYEAYGGPAEYGAADTDGGSKTGGAAYRGPEEYGVPQETVEASTRTTLLRLPCAPPCAARQYLEFKLLTDYPPQATKQAD